MLCFLCLFLGLLSFQFFLLALALLQHLIQIIITIPLVILLIQERFECLEQTLVPIEHGKVRNGGAVVNQF